MRPARDDGVRRGYRRRPPRSLSAAIRLKQLAAKQRREVSVCVLEKGSAVDAQILSVAVMDPTAMNELCPNWKELGAPLNAEVSEDRFRFLSGTKARKTTDRYVMPALVRLCLGEQVHDMVFLPEPDPGINSQAWHDLTWNEAPLPEMQIVVPMQKGDSALAAVLKLARHLQFVTTGRKATITRRLQWK